MKARVKATGEIVDVVLFCNTVKGGLFEGKMREDFKKDRYFENELDFDIQEESQCEK